MTDAFGNAVTPHVFKPHHILTNDCTVCGWGANHILHDTPIVTLSLAYFPINAAYAFIFGSTIDNANMCQLYGFEMFFQTKGEAIEAARHRGLAVDLQTGVVSAETPTPATERKTVTSYDEMTVKQLRQEIRDRGIGLMYLGEMKRAELLEALRRYDRGMDAAKPLAGWDDFGKRKEDAAPVEPVDPHAYLDAIIESQKVNTDIISALAPEVYEYTEAMEVEDAGKPTLESARALSAAFVPAEYPAHPFTPKTGEDADTDYCAVCGMMAGASLAHHTDAAVNAAETPIEPSILTMIDSKDGTVSAYAWPGGYPLYYIAKDGGTMCPTCVNKEIKLIVDETINDDGKQWQLVGREVNWEDANLTCDNCDKRIPSAYAEDDAEDAADSAAERLGVGMACDDCVMAIGSGEYSGMDDARATEVRAAVTAKTAESGALHVGTEHGISSFPCGICGTPLGGNRHSIFAIGK